MKLFIDENIPVESEALEQLRVAERLPGCVAAIGTPDIHTGFGVPIGSVVVLRDYICPAAAGYDINCGMRLLITPYTADQFDKRDLHSLIQEIANLIPAGMTGRKDKVLEPDKLRQAVEEGVDFLESDFIKDFWPEVYGEARKDRIENFGRFDTTSEYLTDFMIQRGLAGFGTLGSGNHFIEVQKVVETYAERGLTPGQIVIMIHSGSRGFGHAVGGAGMKAAKEFGEKINNELAALPADSEEGRKYIANMRCAANYAYLNREILSRLINRVIPVNLYYDVSHNLAALEEFGPLNLWVHRKGATRAYPPSRMTVPPFDEIGQPVLIPGSMGTTSYLLFGHKSEGSFFSVNHGAGRVLSRTDCTGLNRKGKQVREAAVSDEAFKEAMKDIVLLHKAGPRIKEEAPQAYKDIDAVINCVESYGLARKAAKMKPLAVYKG